MSRSRPDQWLGEAKAADSSSSAPLRAAISAFVPPIHQGRPSPSRGHCARRRTCRSTRQRAPAPSQRSRIASGCRRTGAARCGLRYSKCATCRESMDVSQAGSRRFDVRIANDRAKVVILFSKKRGKVHAAYLDWIKPLGYKRPDLWPLNCRTEPTGELVRLSPSTSSQGRTAPTKSPRHSDRSRTQRRSAPPEATHPVREAVARARGLPAFGCSDTVE
jgi:hypothetical protein